MSRTYVDIEAIKEVLADVKDCEDKVYALALLEWAVDKRTISENEIRADERRKIDEYMRNVAHIDISEYLYYYEKEQK